jgi:hypothetical protein
MLPTAAAFFRSDRLAGVTDYPVMRLLDYSPFFQPEELDAMTAAYDAAW